ncbi:hypothetical protein THRCLA_02135 [Thraustotheca clavata]|uniref:Menorin-like domain-containing protein n=1 Tax=Thraustotheca clavata TaxID=74557 RepID=A0A1W0A667_9STRA|nr:hypothetical protein THRCLA_02135 [Thraustotheca clavata]
MLQRATKSSPLHVPWAHAVNSKAKLADAIAKHLAIEADVLLNGKGIPVMAHPPATDSDLSLETFLREVSTSTNGILKLDFKSHVAFATSLEKICRIDASLRQRLWLNADILQGDKGSSPSFDATRFISEALECHVEKLSVGWTTSALSEEYSEEMIDEMLQLLQGINGATLPVKASLVRSSWAALEKVLTTSSHGFTLWSNEKLTEEEMIWLHTALETPTEFKGRTYYDLEGWSDLVAKMQW